MVESYLRFCRSGGVVFSFFSSSLVFSLGLHVLFGPSIGCRAVWPNRGLKRCDFIYKAGRASLFREV